MPTQCPICASHLPYDSVKFCPECGNAFSTGELRLSRVKQYKLVQDWDGKHPLDNFNLVEQDLEGVSLVGASMRGATLSRATLSNADLSGAVMTEAKLQWTALHWANLTGVDLSNADLMGAFLWYSRAPGANFTGANLERATLRDTQLPDANFAWADLQWADLTWANLHNANLGSVNIVGADLSAANLKDAYLGPLTPEGERQTSATEDKSILLAERLVQADFLHKTTLPDGSRYSGYLRLEGDLQRARKMDVDAGDEEAMAEYYDVPLAAYREGQVWADQYLPRLRNDW